MQTNVLRLAFIKKVYSTYDKTVHYTQKFI